jgi:diguanylate cyclase (GGDEF)-like protein
VWSLRPRVGLLRKDNLARVLEADEATLRMLRLAPQDLCGHWSLDLVHPDDRELAVTLWMDMLATPGAHRRARLRHRTGDDGWLWVELTNHNLLADPAHHCVVTEIVDVSDEVAAQQALQDNDRLLHRIAEALPVGVAHIDRDGRLAYRNGRLTDVLRCEPTGERTLGGLLSHLREGDRARLAVAVDTVLAGGDDVELEVRVRRAGASRHCHVTVGGATGADGTLIGAIMCVTDVTDTVQLRERLEHRATYDGLTGCLNRTAVLARTTELLARADGTGGVATIYLDLDGFKLINDRHGHATGDAVLREVGSCLRAAARREDAVGRLGGDEFLIACPGVTSRLHAIGLSRRFEEAVTPIEVEVDGRTFCLRAAVGVTWSPGNEPVETVVARADARMYLQKRRGEHSSAAGA